MKPSGAGAFAPLAALAAGATLYGFGSFVPSAGPTVSATSRGVTLLVAVVVMVRLAKRGDPQVRRSRRFFAAALATAGLGTVVNAGCALFLGHIPVPSPGDPITLMWVPLSIIGLLCLPIDARHSSSRIRTLADGTVAAAALLFSIWTPVLTPVYRNAPVGALAHFLLLAVPIFDVFVVAVTLSVMPRVRSDVRRLLAYIAVGLVCIGSGDIGIAVSSANGGFKFGWPDGIMQAGLIMLLWGATRRPDSTAAVDRRPLRALDILLPYASISIAMVVGLHSTLQGHPLGTSRIVVGAIMVGGLMVRQALYATEARQLASRLGTQATLDPLTGLANRATFVQALTATLAENAPGSAAVILFDLNGFKEINDGFGHDTGDQALVAFADRLRGAAGAGLPARLGGDEFALLLVGGDVELTAVAAASAVTKSGVVRIGDMSFPVEASAGIATSRARDVTSHLLRRADLAMYEAKRSPLSRTALFREEMAARAERRHLLVQELPGAARRGELELLYQPLYRIATGELIGAEALLRWHSPRFGTIGPDEFIPLAEDTGTIGELGRWVIAAALRQLASWDRLGFALDRMFVNLSAREFDDELAGMVLGALHRHQVAPHRLTLEVTESRLPDLAASQQLEHLRAAGVRVAMDDFGAGYSSLAQLARLPVDILKIDREFINTVTTENGKQIVGAVIDLAHALKLQTVAEGIEHADELAVLCLAGCEFGQGYHYARPMRADDFTELLRRALPAQRSAGVR
jgi:diguanylate cyclase (GGDEF)-like protein